MGDLQVWAPQPSGFLNGPSSSRLLTSPSSSSSNPPPLSIASECLQRGEETTCEIIYRIQPTVVSEQRRRDVVEYIQRLIRGWVGCEVFPFGSVPLKTYLPDGDIDLTTVSCLNIEEALANEVRAILEGEEQNPDSEFEVKDVQYIHAEVKLVKCLVQNIVIDISFNQLGGLCTLCFLEQVDHVIGKNHLFKRSIILIKAWCYYESRILGAHHGLISTYALETLVLYIFHLFHSSLHGPLAVLYRFLDYFCKFDWDNYCISLHGPVAISSLPEIVAETPETDGGEVLLSKEFLKSCVERFSSPRVVEANARGFPQKYFNIIDPMKENNNLGRSVSKGNFYRIRSAFSYGARKLGRILLLPPESIGDELKKFFQNTLERHGSGQRPDVNDHISAMPYCASGIGSISFKSVDEEKPIEEKNEKVVMDFPSIDSSATARESKADYKRALIEDTKNMKISVTGKKNGMGDDVQSGTKYGDYQAAVQFNSSKEVGSVSGSRLAGDAQDLATARLPGFRTTNESCKSSSLLGSAEACSSSVPKVHHAPHMYFSGQFAEDGKMSEKKHPFSGENHDWSKVKKSSVLATAYSPVVHSIDEEADRQGLNTSVSSSTTKGFTLWRQNADPVKEVHGGKPFLSSGNSFTAFGSDSKVRSEISEGMAGLSDLSGDFDSHLKCLLYGNYCHEYIYPNAPLSPSGYQSKSWDFSREHARRSAALNHGAYPHVSLNGVVPGPQFPPSYAYYPVTPPFISGAFNMEDFPKTRGTGTYFPNTNRRLYREKNSPSRGGRNTTQGPPSANHNQFSRSRNNGRYATQTDSLVSTEKGSHEPPPPPPPPQLQLPAFGVAGRGKTSPVEFIPANRSLGKGVSHSNGFTIPPERLEFGTFGPVQIGGHLSEQGRLVDSGPVKYSHGPGSLSTTTMPRPELVMKEERVSQAYHLKDEEDFPPLSV